MSAMTEQYVDQMTDQQIAKVIEHLGWTLARARYEGSTKAVLSDLTAKVEKGWLLDSFATDALLEAVGTERVVRSLQALLDGEMREGLTERDRVKAIYREVFETRFWTVKSTSYTDTFLNQIGTVFRSDLADTLGYI
jgi:hypothetical protein